MEATGASLRCNPDGHFFGPPDAFGRAWSAAAGALPPRRLVYFEGLCSEAVGGGHNPHFGWPKFRNHSARIRCLGCRGLEGL